MRELLTTTQFRKDLKKAVKRGKDPDMLERVIEHIVAGEPLDPRHRPHRLSGE
jgi:mRNA interferase YafQ